MEIITALKETPLPTILVIGGLIFLFLGIATIKKPIVIDVTPSSRKIALLVGVLLIISGLYLLLQPASEQQPLAETETPVVNVTETLAASTVIVATENPALLASATVEKLADDYSSIVITEVLGNPCGADSRNEFVELYNSGENSVDISGLWITDGEEADSLISWNTRFASVNLGSLVKVDTTIIPPHGFAVILAPGYPFVATGRIMPYIFAENTTILTLAEGQLIGDEKDGIEVTNRDPIVLYVGSKSRIDKIVSTYGSPILSSSPTSIKDNGTDKIPFDSPSDDCWSVVRVVPVNDDIPTNWEQVQKSSPGFGDYP